MKTDKARLTIKYPRISNAGLQLTEIYGAVVEPYVVSADQLEAFLNKLRREVDDKVFDYQLKNDGLVTKVEQLEQENEKLKATLYANSVGVLAIENTELKMALAKANEKLAAAEAIIKEAEKALADAQDVPYKYFQNKEKVK